MTSRTSTTAARFARQTAAVLSLVSTAASAQTAQFTLSAWAHGLSGAYDEAYFAGASPWSDSASTQGTDSLFDLAGRQGSRAQASRSAGFVAAKQLDMLSSSSTQAHADLGFGTYGTGTVITQGRVSANVPFRVSLPGLDNQPGTLRVPLIISGQVTLSQGFSNFFPGQASGEVEVLFDVSGNAGPATPGCPVGFDRCQRIVDIGGSVAASGAPFAGTLMVDFPFVFGAWTSFSMQLQTRAGANATAIAQASAPGAANVSFLASADYTVHWGGVTAVLGPQGQSVSGWTIASLTGVDLATPVPESGTVPLLLAGLCTLAWRLRRQTAASSRRYDPLARS